MNSNSWIRAQGACGLNVQEDVFALYVQGIALFSYRSRLATPKSDHYCCTIMGFHTIEGATLNDVQERAYKAALDLDILEAKHSISRAQFNELVANPSRITSHDPAIYSIGCFSVVGPKRNGAPMAARATEVPASSLEQALKRARSMLNPSAIEYLRKISLRPNPENVASLEANCLLPPIGR